VQAGFAGLSVIVPSPIVSFGVPAFFLLSIFCWEPNIQVSHPKQKHNKQNVPKHTKTNNSNPKRKKEFMA